MSQSEEVKRLLAEATQKAKEELQRKELLERAQYMSEKDKEALHQLDNPLEHLVFAPIWFANFSLPHKDKTLSKEGVDGSLQRELVLVNGDKRLTLLSRTALPSGVFARKFLFWITTEALKRKNMPLEEACHVPIKSLRSIMKDMDITVNGGPNGNTTTLRKQMNRVLKMAYYEDTVGSPEIDSFENGHVAEKAFFKWDKDSSKEIDLSEGSFITLERNFFLQIADNGAVPLDKRILEKIKRSPLSYDLYVWLTYRLSYNLSQFVNVTFSQLHKQFATGYPDTQRGRRDFKAKVRAAFLKVFQAWEEVTGKAPKAALGSNGIVLYPGAEPSVPKIITKHVVQKAQAANSATSA